MKKNDNKFTLKFLLSLLLYILFFIYEILEKIFNYILLHIKFVKEFIKKVKDKLYSSSFYNWLKIKVNNIDEKTYLGIIVFLIVSSGLMIYVLPFIVSSNILKLILIVIGKTLSTLNIVLNSIGINKLFKIPSIRLFRMRVNLIKRVVKSKYQVFKNFVTKYLMFIKNSTTYKNIKSFFKDLKSK